MTNGIRVGSADIERHAALVERLNLPRRKSGALLVGELGQRVFH